MDKLETYQATVLGLNDRFDGLQREFHQRQSGPAGPGVQPLVSAPVHRNLGPSLLVASALPTAAATAAAAAPPTSPPRPSASARPAPPPDPIRLQMNQMEEEAKQYMLAATPGLPLTGSAGLAPAPVGVAGAFGTSFGVLGRQRGALGAPPMVGAPYPAVTGPGTVTAPVGPPPGLPPYPGALYGYGAPMGVNYTPYPPPYGYPPGAYGYASRTLPLVPVLHPEHFVGKSLVWAVTGVTSAVPGGLGFDPSFATQPLPWEAALAALSSIDVFRKAVWKSGLYLRATGRITQESFDHFSSYVYALLDLGGLTDRWVEAVPSPNGVEYILPVGETIAFALQFHRKIMELVAAGSIGWPSSLGRRAIDSLLSVTEDSAIAPPVVELLNTYRQTISIHASNETARLASQSDLGARIGSGGIGPRLGASSSGHPRAAPSPSAPSAPRAAALVDIGPPGSEAFNRNALDVQGKPAPICTATGTAYCTKFAVSKCSFLACKYAHRCIHCGQGHSLRECEARNGAGTRSV